MIWFDLITPKDVLFFRKFIQFFKKWGIPVLVTAREGTDYKEVIALLKLYGIEHINIGIYGGNSLKGKFLASLERQKKLLEIIDGYSISKLINFCSVDANRVAFGLGIPIVNFYDIPLASYTFDLKKALPQARLTIPLSKVVYHPYLVPREIFLRFGLEEEQVRTYKFYDVYLWLHDFKPNPKFVEEFYKKHNLDKSKPLVLVREEEFKASYVGKKYPLLYRSLDLLNKILPANYVIIPRYEVEPLKKKFPFAVVVEEKFHVHHLMAYADLFIGGGGTMNAESCFFGTPTISTRSFISHYDKALIDAGLMVHVKSEDELIYWAKKLIGKRLSSRAKKFFGNMELNFPKLAEELIEL